MAYTHSGLLPAYLAGLMLSNNSTSPDTVLDIAPGIAADDVAGILMQLPVAFTKALASSWAAGSGSNGLDTGSIAVSTWYHVYLIQKNSDGSTDILFSASPSSPAMPSGYTNKRRIGSVRTNGSAHIIAFSQSGDEFLWRNVIQDVDTTQGTTAVLYTLTVPSGFKVDAKFRSQINHALQTAVVYNSPDENSITPNSPIGNVSMESIGDNRANSGQFTVRTNASSQISVIANLSSSALTIVTYGWIDQRGRLG